MSSVSRSVGRPVARSVLAGQLNTLASIIKSLFANSEQGFAYDPNDLTTMWQDAAGTIPVTAAGQPVGLMLDKSGRNNHAYQTVSASRPILQRNATTGAYYLAFDGVDDFLQTNNIYFTVTDKLSLFAGVHKFATTRGTIAELGAGGSGRFMLTSHRPISTSFSFLGENTSPFPSVNAQDSAVLTGIADLSNRTHKLTANSKDTNSATWGEELAASYQNAPLYIGMQRGVAYPFTGHLYSLIGIGRLTTDSETIALEKYIAKNTGVTLSV